MFHTRSSFSLTRTPTAVSVSVAVLSSHFLFVSEASVDGWPVALTTAYHKPLVIVNSLSFSMVYLLYFALFDKLSFSMRLLSLTRPLLQSVGPQTVRVISKKSPLYFLISSIMRSSNIGGNKTNRYLKDALMYTSVDNVKVNPL